MRKTYEDIVDLLELAKLPWLSGKGVSEAEIVAAESILGLEFPASFRGFLHSHGWGYFGSLEVIPGLGADIPSEWKAGVDLIRVIADERHGPLRLPLCMIPINQNGAGDWYVIDCSRRSEGDAPVMLIRHERAVLEFQAEWQAENFAEWIYSSLSTT